jgi:hypothetical protein
MPDHVLPGLIGQPVTTRLAVWGEGCAGGGARPAQPSFPGMAGRPGGDQQTMPRFRAATCGNRSSSPGS